MLQKSAIAFRFDSCCMGKSINTKSGCKNGYIVFSKSERFYCIPSTLCNTIAMKKVSSFEPLSVRTSYWKRGR